jgi:hypothetical protein
MQTTPDPERLEKRRQEIRAELAAIRDLRPGSLAARFRKCGKPNCHCATEEGGGHGPSWSLTRKVSGKTVTKIIPASAVAQTEEQIAEYRRFRQLTNELVEVSEGICEAKLATTSASDGAVKKGASKRPSTSKSSPRSKRL